MLLIIVPPFAGSVGLLALTRRAVERTTPYRLFLISFVIARWLAGALLARAAENDAAHLVTRPLLGVAVAVAVLAAYNPPAWMRRRFGLAALREEMLQEPQPRLEPPREA